MEGHRCGAVGGGGPTVRLSDSLRVSDHSLSAVPIPLPGYSLSSIKRKARQEEIEALIARGV